MKRPRAPEPQAPVRRGSFRSDGSWDPEGNPDSQLNRFVRRCLWMRHNGASPKDLALYIEGSEWEKAFPRQDLEQWKTCALWANSGVDSWPREPRDDLYMPRATASITEALRRPNTGGEA